MLKMRLTNRPKAITGEKRKRKRETAREKKREREGQNEGNAHPKTPSAGSDVTCVDEVNMDAFLPLLLSLPIL